MRSSRGGHLPAIAGVTGAIGGPIAITAVLSLVGPSTARDYVFVYVALVIDCFSRAIVGWQVCKTKDTAMVTTALKMALWRRDHYGHAVGDGLIHHSDAGSPIHIHCVRRNPSPGGYCSIDRQRRRRV